MNTEKIKFTYEWWEVPQGEQQYLRIAKKAQELFEQRGSVPGHEQEDWFKAERIVQEEMQKGEKIEKK